MKKRCKTKEVHQKSIDWSCVSKQNYLEDVAHAQLLISFHTVSQFGKFLFLSPCIFCLVEETGQKRKHL